MNGGSQTPVVRHNILTDAGSRQRFAEGVNALKQDFSAGVTTATLGFSGPARPVSAYDQFVIWHYVAMGTPTPLSPNPRFRNAAHRGPIFLPWHRFMLLLLEQHLRRVLGDNTFGLPYWDWAADSAEGVGSPLWTNEGVGGDGIPISDGPFAANEDPDVPSFRVFFYEDLVDGRFKYIPGGRGLWRQLGQDPDFPGLPEPAHVQDALRNEQDIDASDWDTASTGFRNRLEGWVGHPGGGPGLHNRVHVWVGGDMSPGSSPNDPVFYLNHCNVDRIWEAWLVNNGRTYLPGDQTPGAPVGHRESDEMVVLTTTSTMRPVDVLDLTNLYTYDTLPQF